MATAWFLCQYKRRPGPRPTRYCAMDDYTAQIEADGGRWAEAEVLGNWAICKVAARAATLDTIAAAPGFRRLTKAALGLSLADLTAGQKATLLSWVTDMGYTVAEIRAALGNDLGAHTLGDVLRFVAKRRLKARYDQATDTIILDGPEQACKSPDAVDAEV